MYGQATKQAALLPATGLASPWIGWGATALAIITIGFMLIAFAGLARRRRHALP